MEIRYVSYSNIDKSKWDSCISNAVNGLIYSRSFYLDIMAGKWDAVVMNDYEAVMPLPYRKKWGIRYLYQPAFVQQSGIFFQKELLQEQLQSFISIALQHFKFAEISLNFANNIKAEDDSFKTVRCNNFLLDLSLPYENLYKNYLPAFTKSLRRLKKLELEYSISRNVEKYIELYKQLYSKRLPQLSAKDFLQFTMLCKKMASDNNLVIRYASDKTGALLASAVLLKDEKRLYNIISCITEAGKKQEVNYFLYDRIINEFTNSDLFFDFEGSDIKGVEDFYKKFNPVNQPYQQLRANNLPAIIKLFKP